MIPPTYIGDASNNAKTTASIEGNSIAVNEIVFVDPLLSPVVFHSYNHLSTPGGRGRTTTMCSTNYEENNDYSSFALGPQEEDHPVPLPTGATKYLEEVEGLQLEMRSSVHPSAENDTGSMKLEPQTKESSLKSDDESQEQQEGRSISLLEIRNFLGCHENAALSFNFRSAFESARNANEQSVTPADPRLLPSAQEEQEEQEQNQEADDDYDDERNHLFSSFPFFSSSSPTFRQQERNDHHQQRTVRRPSNDDFVIEGMDWEKDEYQCCGWPITILTHLEKQYCRTN